MQDGNQIKHRAVTQNLGLLMSSGTRKDSTSSLFPAHGRWQRAAKAIYPRGEPITTRGFKPNLKDRTIFAAQRSSLFDARVGRSQQRVISRLSLVIKSSHCFPRRARSIALILSSLGDWSFFSPSVSFVACASAFACCSVVVVEEDSTHCCCYIHRCTTAVPYQSSPAGLSVATRPLSTPFACCERVRESKN